GAFGGVHGDVRMAHERVRIVTVARKGGNANAGADRQLAAVQHQWLVERGLQLQRDALRHLRVSLRQDNGELVAAQARDGIGRAQCTSQTERYFLQKTIAGVMTKRVVDLFEAVEVKHQERAR